MWMAIDSIRKDVDGLKSEKTDHNHHHSAFTQDVKTPAGTYPAYIILAILALIALRPDVIGQYLSR
jgi:hypothetical protein